MIAGILITMFNFGTLFSAGALLLVAGAVILFLGKENYEPTKIDIKQTWKYLINKQSRRNFWSFGGYAIEASINRIVWPIYLIILLLTYDKLGIIVTLSFVLSVLAFYLIGDLTDKYDKIKLIKIMTGFYFLGWMARILANSGMKVLIVDSYKNLAEKFLFVPWQVAMYDLAAAEKDKFYMFIITREIMYNLARILILPLLVLIFYINFHPFLISFALAAGFSLLYPVLRKI